MMSEFDENGTDPKPCLSAFEWIWNYRLGTSLAKVTIESSWCFESENVPGVRPDDWVWELFSFSTLNIEKVEKT